MFEEQFRSVKRKHPLIHSITNLVTINDVANMIIACGASPIMAIAPEEVQEITAIADGLNINIGTLQEKTVEAMLLSGSTANMKGIPVILDPVGVGASSFRKRTVHRLLQEIRFSAIKGNAAEIRCLLEESGEMKGVDGAEEGTMESFVSIAISLSKKTGAVVIMSGETDIVTDGSRTCMITNGHPMMKDVSGTGCMLSGMITSFCAADSHHLFEAACAAVMTMGIAGEKASEAMLPSMGNATYRARIIDAVYTMKETDFKESVRYEMQ